MHLTTDQTVFMVFLILAALAFAADVALARSIVALGLLFLTLGFLIPLFVN